MDLKLDLIKCIVGGIMMVPRKEWVVRLCGFCHPLPFFSIVSSRYGFFLCLIPSSLLSPSPPWCCHYCLLQVPIRWLCGRKQQVEQWIIKENTRGPSHEICAWVCSLGLSCDQGHLPQLPATGPAPCLHPPPVPCLPLGDQSLPARGKDPGARRSAHSLALPPPPPTLLPCSPLGDRSLKAGWRDWAVGHSHPHHRLSLCGTTHPRFPVCHRMIRACRPGKGTERWGAS